MAGKRNNPVHTARQSKGRRAKTPRAERRRTAWTVALPLVVVIAGVVAYANSVDGIYILDDIVHINNNQSIRSFWPPNDWLTRTRRPVLNLTFVVNYALGGLAPTGYHVGNIAIHIAAALALFGVVHRTLRRGAYDWCTARSAPWVALAVALLWVVHPLQTQSVTYIIQRGEALMGLFYLATVYCVIRGADSSRSAGWYAASVLSCLLGMGSKAVMVTAPVVVLLFDRTFLSGSFKKALHARAPLYIALAATWTIIAATGVLRGVLFPGEGAKATVGLGFKDITPVQYALSEPGVILHYLRLALWPHPLCLDYAWPVAHSLYAVMWPTIALAILVGGVGWAIIRRPRLGFLGAWFFLILLPTSSIIPIKDPAFEHRMYLPLAAVVVFGVFAGGVALRRLALRAILSKAAVRTIAVGLTIGLASIYTYATIQRNTDYHSVVSLWRSVIESRPGNVRAHDNLGIAYMESGRSDKATACFHEALRLDPRDSSASINLGILAERRRDITQAIGLYREAIRVDPDSDIAHTNLCNMLAQQGKLDEAIAECRQALKLNSRHVYAHTNLARLFVLQGDLDRAVKQYRRTLVIEPLLPEARLGLANTLKKRGDTEEAFAQLRELLRQQPQYARGYQQLGNWLRGQSDFTAAIAAYKRALELDPHLATAYTRLGVAYVGAGQLDLAVTTLREAANLSPRDATPRFHLGMVLMRLGQEEDAVEQFRAALRIDPNHARARQALARIIPRVNP